MTSSQADKLNPSTELTQADQILPAGKAAAETGSSGFIGFLDKINLIINKSLAWIAGACLMIMVFVVVGNAVSRVVYVPYAGATEIVGWLSALTTAFALGYTQVMRGYVDIDALVERFPAAWQRIIKVMVDFVSFCFFAMTGWKMVAYAFIVVQNGNLSETIGIPFYPFIILVAVGFFGLALALLVDLLKQLTGGEAR